MRLRAGRGMAAMIAFMVWGIACGQTFLDGVVGDGAGADGGTDGEVCEATETRCPGGCVALGKDPQNCGACHVFGGA